MYMDTPLSTLLPQVGFTAYHETVLKLPMGQWPAGKRLKEIGKWGQLILESGFEAYGLALFTRTLSMPLPEAKQLIADCKTEVSGRKVHSYAKT
jgi:hypothetical protein